VPLLVVGDKVPSQLNNNLLSHLDIPQIIYHFAASEKHPNPHKEIYLMGSTGKWVYGMITKEKEYLFIDNAPGTILSKMVSLNPEDVKIEFQGRLDMFNGLYKK